MKIFPDNIKTIAVIAPAGIPDIKKIEENKKFLENLGYKILLSSGIFKRSDKLYLASTIQQRIEDLHNFWKNTDIDIIIAARGGYGSAQLLPYLDWNLIKTRDIPFLGYSDITAIHLGMYSKKCKTLISAPMFQNFINIKNDKYTISYLKNILDKNVKQVEITPKCKKKKFIAIKKGEAQGKLIPVTLSVLTTLLGTNYMPNFKNTILLIEDINEPLYKLDRYLTQLLHSGILTKIKGMLIGSFTNCSNQHERLKLFTDFSKYVNGPIILNIPFGHSFSRISIPFGIKCKITTDNSIFCIKS